MNRLHFPSLAFSALGLLPASAQINWSHSFQASGDTLPPFESGVLIPFPITSLNQTHSGYALDAASSRPNPRDPESEFDLGFLSRFDATGALLWSIALDPGASATSLDLSAIPGDSTQFFGTYEETPGTLEKAFRLGLFRGADRSTMFAKRFVTSSSTSHSVEYFNGEKMGVTLDKGSTIESVVFNATGDPIFNQSYSSPLFSASNPPTLVQTIVRDLLPDQSGYLTAVAKTSFNFDPERDFSTDVTLIPFFTNLAGEVTSSNSFTFETFSPGTVPFPSVLSDNSVLYRIPAITGGITIGGNRIPVTHLLKVNPNGTIAWSKTIPTTSILAVFPSPAALYLAGSQSNSSGPGNSNALVLKINPANGTLMGQAAFDTIDQIDNAASISSDGTHLFVQILSVDPFAGSGDNFTSTSTLVKLDGDLNLINAKQYLGPQTVASLTPDDPINAINRFLFTAHDPIDGRIKSITLNDQLEPIAGCNLFSPFTPSFGTGVTINDLSVSTAPAHVTATNIQTPHQDSTISFTPAPLDISELCSLSRGLTIHPNAGSTEIILNFPTESGITYSLDFTPDLSTPFTSVQSVIGDGTTATLTRPIGAGKGFYRVSPPPPTR